MSKSKPIPADIECRDEVSARAMAHGQQAKESDPSIFWVERQRRADGQWVAHPSRTGDDRSGFKATLADALNPLHWLGLKGSQMAQEPGSALDPALQNKPISKYFD